MSDQSNPSRLVLVARNIGALTAKDVSTLSPSRIRAALTGRGSLEELRSQSKPSAWDYPIWSNPWGRTGQFFDLSREASYARSWRFQPFIPTAPSTDWSRSFNFPKKPWYQKPIDAVVDFCKHVAAVANAVWKAVHKDEKSA